MNNIDLLGLDRFTLEFLKISEKNLERSINGYTGMYEIGESIIFDGLIFIIYECGEMYFGSGKYFYNAVYSNKKEKRYINKVY